VPRPPTLCGTGTLLSGLLEAYGTAPNSAHAQTRASVAYRQWFNF